MRVRRLSVLVASLALVFSGLGIPHASAAVAPKIEWTQETGTAPFNTKAGAGYDVSASDSIVRTNDQVTYHLSTSIEGETMTNPVVKVTFPQGQEMKTLPAYCLAGSSLTPTMAPPVLPVTETSWQSLPQQTLTCVLNDISPGAASGITFATTVRPEMPNGAVMGPVTATITNTNPNVSPVTTAPLSQTVSAAAKWDLSINGATATENSAFVKQATVQRCSQGYGYDGQWCFVGGYPVTLSIPDGGKGGTPMSGGSFTFQIDTDPVTLWGPAAAGLDPKLWGGHVTIKQDSPYESPNSRLSQGTALNSVRNSGTITTTQSAPGAPVVVSVTGADTTAYTVPTDAGSPTGYKVRTDRGQVWTQRIFIEVPMTSFMADPTKFDTSPLPTRAAAPITVTANESSLRGWTSVTGLSGSGSTNLYADADGTKNNYRKLPALLDDFLPATNFWTSPPNYATATPPAVFSPAMPAWYGPSGPAGIHNGDGVAVVGQTLLSTIELAGNSMNGVTSLVCQTFDNTKVQLLPGFTWPSGGPAMAYIGPNQYAPYTDTDTGGATWIHGSMFNFNNVTQLGASARSDQTGMVDRYGDFIVQYGSGPASTNCDGDITWSSTPSATTNHVRFLLQSKPGINAVFQRTAVSIAFKSIDSTIGDRIPTWVDWTGLPGANHTLADLTNPALTWVRSGYDPQANTPGYVGTGTDTPDYQGIGGRLGDRVTVVGIEGRTGKTVEDAVNPATPGDDPQLSNISWIPSTRLWVKTNRFPVYAPTNKFNYVLSPRLEANPMPPAGTTSNVLVEDCLPQDVVFDSASLNPNYIGSARSDWPFEPVLQCKPGSFYLAWYFARHDVSKPLPPITVTARVLETASTTGGATRNDDTIANSSINTVLVTARDEKGTIQTQTRVPAPRLKAAALKTARIAPMAGDIIAPIDLNSPEATAIDVSIPDQRMAQAGIVIQAPDQLSLSKFTATPLIFVDPNGWVSNQEAQWTIRARNLNSGQTITDLDIIDFLPKSGVAGSTFAGPGDFVRAAVVPSTDTSVQLLYTKAGLGSATVASWSDAANTALNGPSGSTVWCSGYGSTATVVSGSGTAADCPQSAAEVTGLRVKRPGDFPNGATLEVQVFTNAQRNVPGNVMENTAVLRASGIDVPMASTDRVVFNYRDVPLNSGVISGNVWDDIDHDGVWDPTEPPIPGTKVTITDSKGNVVGTAYTDENGHYAVPGLSLPPRPENPPADWQPSETFTVTFTTPDGYSPTVPGQQSVAPVTKVTLDRLTQYVDNVDGGYVKPGTLALTKAVTSSTGGPVTEARPGDELTYTVTVTNTSDRPFTTDAPATVVDSLAKVIDDGSVVSGSPTATVGTVTLVSDQLVWTGALPAKDKVVLTYKVIVTGDGDLKLDNVAFTTPRPVDPKTGVPTNPDGTPVTPPATCAAPTCAATSTPVKLPESTPPVTPPAPTPSVALTKTVTGATGPEGRAEIGDVLTYTVTVKNTGAVEFTASSPATVVDDLSLVVDDATLSGGVSASAGKATVVGKRIIWQGPLPVEGSVTLTYQVKVTGKGNLNATNIAFVTTVPVDVSTGAPVDQQGKPVAAPAECTAPTCARTSTDIVVKPTAPPRTGVDDSVLPVKRES